MIFFTKNNSSVFILFLETHKTIILIGFLSFAYKSRQGSRYSYGEKTKTNQLSVPRHLILSLLIFVSQVALDPLGSTSPVTMGPAWMVVPVGRSVLVVARDSQWAHARWDAIVLTANMKQQPPSNVWTPPLTLGRGAGHFSAMLSFESQSRRGERPRNLLTLLCWAACTCSIECSRFHYVGIPRCCLPEVIRVARGGFTLAMHSELLGTFLS